MCLYVLKEILEYYHSHNTTVFVTFIDASKAFDRVNYVKLFHKMLSRSVPVYIVRLLSFWYSKQCMRVKWGNDVSVPFNVSNGVKQESILSPLLFNVYMNDLSVRRT